MKQIAAVYTLDEIQNFFKGPIWKESELRGNTFYARSLSVTVEFEQDKPQYYLKIVSKDDELDSEEIVTEKPTEEIINFITEGLPSSYKLSNKHNILKLAMKIANIFNLNESRNNTEQSALENLRKDINKVWKKWNVDLVKDKQGFSQLDIEIPGFENFDIKISVESIFYYYFFQITDHPELNEDGITEDPIREFERYVDNPKNKEMIEEIGYPKW